MKAVAPAPSGHKAARKLIHDYYLAVFYNIVLVFFKKIMRAQGLYYMVFVFHGFEAVQVGYSQKRGCFLFAVFRKVNCLRLFIYDIIARLLFCLRIALSLFETGNYSVYLVVFVG